MVGNAILEACDCATAGSRHPWNGMFCNFEERCQSDVVLDILSLGEEMVGVGWECRFSAFPVTSECSSSYVILSLASHIAPENSSSALKRSRACCVLP